MEIHFKSAHTKDVEQEVTSDLMDLTEKKITTLKKYLGKTDLVTQVYVELGTITEAHHSGVDKWRAQINLESNGKKYHALATAERLQSAIDTAVHELEAELSKAKKRNESMLRKGGAFYKSVLRGFRAS